VAFSYSIKKKKFEMRHLRQTHQSFYKSLYTRTLTPVKNRKKLNIHALQGAYKNTLILDECSKLYFFYVIF